jgi:uncharacterized protein (TIGR04255 family)
LTSKSPEHYNKPPIVEAVIDLRVVPPANAKVHDKIVRRLKQTHPHFKTIQETSVSVDTSTGSVTVDKQPMGCRLSTEDEADVVLVRAASLTIARLAPYKCWENLRDRARQAWQIWTDCKGPGSVSRIGVRYINRIDIPVERNQGIKLEDYLSFYPRIPDPLDNTLHSYLTQATIATAEPYWNAKISSTLIKPAPLVNHISLLLDIDLFRTECIKIAEEDLWVLLEKARDIKNMIFESSVTEESRRLFNVI